MVSNIKDLELLMMHNRSYAGEIAHNVSTLKRKAIVERASEVRAIGVAKLLALPESSPKVRLRLTLHPPPAAILRFVSGCVAAEHQPHKRQREASHRGGRIGFELDCSMLRQARMGKCRFNMCAPFLTCGAREEPAMSSLHAWEQEQCTALQFLIRVLMLVLCHMQCSNTLQALGICRFAESS